LSFYFYAWYCQGRGATIALVKCKECGEQVSTKAKHCPKCGAVPKKETSVFKWLLLLCVLFAAFITTRDLMDTSTSIQKKAIPQKTTSPAKGDVIEEASIAQTNLIQMALGEKYIITKTAAVKSGNHPNAYYVGANFHPIDIYVDKTGIWLIGGSKEKTNVIYSVNGTAEEFSKMRMVNETKASAYITDPEAKTIRKYLEQ
jgi:hypothetical protein